MHAVHANIKTKSRGELPLFQRSKMEKLRNIRSF